MSHIFTTANSDVTWVAAPARHLAPRGGSSPDRARLIANQSDVVKVVGKVVGKSAGKVGADPRTRGDGAQHTCATRMPGKFDYISNDCKL